MYHIRLQFHQIVKKMQHTGIDTIHIFLIIKWPTILIMSVFVFITHDLNITKSFQQKTACCHISLLLAAESPGQSLHCR